MRLWYLSHRRTAKAQVSLRIHAVSPEPSLFAHMKYGSRQRVRPKIRHLASLDGCACAFEEWGYAGQNVPYSHELAQLCHFNGCLVAHEGFVYCHRLEQNWSYKFYDVIQLIWALLNVKNKLPDLILSLLLMLKNIVFSLIMWWYVTLWLLNFGLLGELFQRHGNHTQNVLILASNTK